MLSLVIYGFIASVLPIWLLLIPRDYLSSYMKIGTIGALVLGVIIVNPELKMPAFTQFIHGGGPIIPGKLFPFLFVTIACGAISGFHALISSGTTPKLISKESDTRFIGYGAMLMEGLVGIVALIAACSLEPGDYFAINLSAQKFAALGMSPVHLDTLSREVGETVAGRPGGAVSLAVGFAYIFTGLPGLEKLMGFWYHFAIMFEALFILTTIDAGTRVMRFMVQEFGGRIWKPMERTDWLPANILATTIVVCSWGYFLWTGNISTLWPMFGTANQLLAAVALSVATSVIINGAEEICVDHHRPDGVRCGYNAHGRGAEHHGQLLAAHGECCHADAGDREQRDDAGDDLLCDHGPGRGAQTVEPRRAARRVRAEAQGSRPRSQRADVRRVLLTRRVRSWEMAGHSCHGPGVSLPAETRSRGNRQCSTIIRTVVTRVSAG